MPDYSLYVVMVFFQATNEPANVRQIAGLLLKDYVKLQVTTRGLSRDPKPASFFIW